MKNSYNFIFWYNPYEKIWYAITRDSQLEFFNGKRENSTFYKSSQVATLVEIIDKDIVEEIV